MGSTIHKVTLPLRTDDIERIKAGDEVRLFGQMLVGRDQAHKRLIEMMERSATLPVSLIGETIYYMGPAPAPPGRIIGSCGPTTAARMDPFTPQLLDAGLKGMIGKGPRSRAVRDAAVRNRALYFYAYGGCGALYAQTVTSVRTAAFADLGPEALLVITVEDFPVLAALDARGNAII
jgi:fumarate hydratase subunit beta